MNDALATALEDARSRLTSGVEEAEAELLRARARARELRVSLIMARELAGIGAGIASAAPTAAPASSAKPARARLDLTNPPRIAAPHPLSLRRRAALEGLRRIRHPKHVRASFSPDVVLRWDGDSPFAGTYRGRKDALAMLELVLREIDPSVDPEPRVHVQGDTVVVEAQPGSIGTPGDRLSVTFVVGFDEHDRIDHLSITPEEGDALDRLIEAVIG